MVAPFEERDAARFSGYNWTAWRRLDPYERALCVAYMRVSRAASAHSQHAANEEHKRRQKKAQRKASRRGGRRF